MVLVVEVVLYLGFFSVIMPTVTSSKYVDKEKKEKTREKKNKEEKNNDEILYLNDFNSKIQLFQLKIANSLIDVVIHLN